MQEYSRFILHDPGWRPTAGSQLLWKTVFFFFFTYEGKHCQELKYGRPLPPFASLTTLGKSAIAF